MKKTELQFSFDGQKLIGTSRHTTVEIGVEDWNEIGIELIHHDSLRPIFCLVINRRAQNIRVANTGPVFKALLDYCSSLDGFDWQPLVGARLVNAYSLCWHRSTPAPSATADTMVRARTDEAAVGA